MSQTNDPVDAHLALLARSTLAAAPRPLPPAVVRILAGRRRAALGSCRLLAFVAVASAAPLPIILVAWILSPAVAGGSHFVPALLAFVLPPAIGGIARFAGTSAPTRA